MSREIRRVPLDWKHPTEYDPYWEQHSRTWRGEKRPPSRLHAPTERFIALYETPFSEAHATWVEEKAQWEAGTHRTLIFSLKYHSPEGWVDRNGVMQEPTPYVIYDPKDHDTVIDEIFPTSMEELLAVYPYSQYASEPTVKYYMPDFPKDAVLGYCLYESVSEGTPVTPVFATQEELIDWLATMGQDYDQVPLRLESAIAIVRQGGTFGSMMVVNNQLYNTTEDADKLETLHEEKKI